jgi:hypothetical protein
LRYLNALQQYLPLLVLWCAICAIASLVVRELGFKTLRKHPLPALVLCVSLAAFPLAGVYRVVRPIERRVVDRFLPIILREKSTTILQSGCPMFPPDNIWNRRVRDLPVEAHSDIYIGSMGRDDKLHADFGQAGGYRYAVTDGTESNNDMEIQSAGESDPGPYRIPDDVPVEEGSDGHVLVVDRGNCLLYELFGAERKGQGHWSAGSAAIFDLRSNRLRPDGWTSADAAGDAIIPGLVRYDEVASGHIDHALRFTTRHTRRATLWPARHFASRSTDASLPPMGLRVRLRASVDISHYSPQTRVILTALKEYGMFLADNGGNWFISGALDTRWASSVPRELATLHGSDLEAVDESGLMIDPNSGQARQ